MKHQTILCMLWLFIFATAKSQPSIVPTPSVVYPRIGNSSYYNWIICINPAYVNCIDTRTNLPAWVSHVITKEFLEYGDTIKRKRPKNPSYSKDERYKTLKSDAYNGTGYDHGHMAPAADFKWDAEAYRTSFLMTNMSPQHACFNQKGWCHLEAQCRKWARENEECIIYIVTGVILESWIDTLCISKKLTIFVPGKLFKAILLYDSIGDESKAIGFIMENRDIPISSVNEYAVTVDQIEEQANLELFSFLPNNMEEQIESAIGDFEIVTTTLDCPDKDCNSIYSGNRIRPENRTKYRCK